MDRYNFKITEEKWQKLWEEEKVFSTKVIKNKKNNNLKNGKIDLIWVNGENFQRLKKNQLLFGPVDQIKNYTYINRRDLAIVVSKKNFCRMTINFCI